MRLQKTIANEVKLAGKGLFSGKDVRVTFRPADPDTGIVFLRTDTEDPVRIPAIAANIAERDRRTALKKGSVSIETPEHCLASINALGISNIIVEIDGQELPGFDGSADEYFKSLGKAGIVEQQAECKEFVITKAVNLSEGDHGFLQWNTDYLSYDTFTENHRAQMKLMEDFTAEQGIEFLNLTPDFWEQQVASGELYHYADPHWNQAGNQLAADIIAGYLRSH